MAEHRFQHTTILAAGLMMALSVPLFLSPLGCASGAGSGDPDAGGPGTGGLAVGGATGTGGVVVGSGGGLGNGGSASGSAGSPGSGGTVGTGGRGGTTGAGGLPGAGGAIGTGGRGTGGATTTGAGGATGAGGRTGTLRIMPLGDSTTGSVCYRAQLWQMLNQGGFTGRFDFVGSRRNDPGCGVAGYDQDNEGHPGVLVTNFITDADETVNGVQTLQSVLGPHPADVVLLHFATNDVWNSVNPTTILAAYTTTLNALRAANPNVVILAAKLIPLVPINVPVSCPACACPTACDQRMVAFNDMIPAWATSHSTAASPIMVVDQHTGFVSTSDTVDGVHPNAAGSVKIAAKWYAALQSLF